MSEHLAEGDLLSVPQVQRLLPLARSTIYALVESGALPCYRIGAAGGGRARVLVHKADLMTFIERARQAATRAPVRVDVDQILESLKKNKKEAIR